jgi:uncharacterized protein
VKQALVLQDLFLYLVENGFPLGIRDYKDALKALKMGYGLSGKKKLLWLCRTLWARTEEEKRFLDMLFSQFAFAVDEETKKLLEQIEPPSGEDAEGGPADQPDFSLPPGDPQKTSRETGSVPTVNFASAGNQKSGIGLPRASVEPVAGEYFILSPRTIVSVRRLTIIWRRFKAVKREGPKTELDLDATVKEKCRRGIIGHPVLIPARRNQAKLIVIVDASPSMSPWMDFNNALAKSLDRGQLGAARLFYFYNTPDEVLYEKETLNKPKKIAEIVKEHKDSALLVISDGGAARGYQNRSRVLETNKFLADVAAFWHPVAWLNPMPVKRWKTTTAESVKQLLNGNMYELNEEGLIKAIDVLRGKKF